MSQQDAEAFQESWKAFMQAGMRLMQNFNTQLNSPAPSAFAAFAAETSRPDSPLLNLQQHLMHDQLKLWQSALKKSAGEEPDFVVHPERGDRRFRAAEWSASPVHEYLQQAYLLNSRYLNEAVELLPAEDEKTRQKQRFSVRQLIEASSPANFAATNPEFIKTALESEGRSITEGARHLFEDLRRGRISTTDESAFEVGKNVATTEGTVVHENAVMQLIQYKPLTAKVGKRPLLMTPPCINKYYILDLQPENSLVRYVIEQGHTLFLISWKNPGQSEAHLTWDDYVEGGPLSAIRIVKQICKTNELNALGFCVGGTMLVTALAVLAARGDTSVKSLTLLTTLLDFAEAGEISLFVEEKSLAAREEALAKGHQNLLTGQELYSTFSALRGNDLIWNYVVNNYLKGIKPPAFDLLYWNADSTNLPGRFAVWYMRNMYLENRLCVPGKVTVCGTPVNLGNIKMPSYILATREDHIVPWQSAYRSFKLLGGKKRFTLSASGHIAGVINPASKNKRHYWLNTNYRLGASKWLERAENHPGSWWSNWAAWLKEHKGEEKNAPRNPGGGKYKPIEPAPGRYVKQKA